MKYYNVIIINNNNNKIIIIIIMIMIMIMVMVMIIIIIIISKTFKQGAHFPIWCSSVRPINTIKR